MAPYPDWVLQALVQPAAVLSTPRPPQVQCVARAHTPASEEFACLYVDPSQGVWCWRALAGPWLAALLDGVCSRLREDQGAERAREWLEELEIPPTKRYCVVLVRALLQGVRELENSDG